MINVCLRTFWLTLVQSQVKYIALGQTVRSQCLSSDCLSSPLCPCRRLWFKTSWRRRAADKDSKSLHSSSLPLLHLRQWHCSDPFSWACQQGAYCHPCLSPWQPPVQVPAQGKLCFVCVKDGWKGIWIQNQDQSWIVFQTKINSLSMSIINIYIKQRNSALVWSQRTSCSAVAKFLLPRCFFFFFQFVFFSQEDTWGVASGWGRTRYLGRSSRFLRKVSLPVVSYRACAASTEQVIRTQWSAVVSKDPLVNMMSN